ncbi:MAG: response regulator transcription factor [Chloroflexota bacterium]|nr:response regulator transcription factor [Chloroflexota bacterium]
MDGKDSIELVIVDEHPLVRAGVRTMLENDWGMEVVGEADSVEEALSYCREHRPDVVLMDLDLPAPGLLQGVQRLRRECADSAVVILSHRDGDEELYQAAVAGASGHVAEEDEPAALADTIRLAALGEEPIGQRIAGRPSVSRRVLEMYRQLAQTSVVEHDGAPSLSARDAQILRYVAAGLTNRQIGQAMGISENTVKAAVSSILRRLGLRHRTEAVVYAVRRGWISVPDGPSRSN